MNLLMAASENDGIRGAKVGGIGDVIRDVPPELAKFGHYVTVLVPSYGFLHSLNESRWIARVDFSFGGSLHQAEIYDVQGKSPVRGVRHLVLDHPALGSEKARPSTSIYSFDPPHRPFATDATRFALFCAAGAQAMVDGVFGPLDCIHLHDWHTAFLLVLRRYNPAVQVLKSIRTVFTIHNLALQGIRPFRGDASSLDAWYPDMSYDEGLLADPRWTNCINPMASAVRLADVVHTVSPTYADEILRPDKKPQYHGGEGLETDLNQARSHHRLFGILNGCPYDPETDTGRVEWPEAVERMTDAVIGWMGGKNALLPAHFVAYARLQSLLRMGRRPSVILTYVGRITEQKMYLMMQSGSDNRSGLEGILGHLKGRGIFIMLGTGDREYETALNDMASRFDHFVFLNGYSDACASLLYREGDLFVMPSSFEPCGISQMLAMRSGRPCLVHGVGGLNDTVQNRVNGFVFTGDTVTEQVDNFVRGYIEAVDIKQNHPDKWQKIQEQAAASRFSWERSVREYMRDLYRFPSENE